MYFDQPGKVNTAATMTQAPRRAQELDLDEIVLATTGGDTAYAALEHCPGFKITALVIKPAHQSSFFDLRVREIICKPRDF